METIQLLAPYREKIDALDDQIIDLLVKRDGLIREVGQLKFDHNIPAIIAERVDEVRERAAKRGEQNGLDPDLIRVIYSNLIDYSCNLEEEIKAQLMADGKDCAA